MSVNIFSKFSQTQCLFGFAGSKISVNSIITCVIPHPYPICEKICNTVLHLISSDNILRITPPSGLPSSIFLFLFSHLLTPSNHFFIIEILCITLVSRSFCIGKITEQVRTIPVSELIALHDRIVFRFSRIPSCFLLIQTPLRKFFSSILSLFSKESILNKISTNYFSF